MRCLTVLVVLLLTPTWVAAQTIIGRGGEGGGWKIIRDARGRESAEIRGAGSAWNFRWPPLIGETGYTRATLKANGQMYDAKAAADEWARERGKRINWGMVQYSTVGRWTRYAKVTGLVLPAPRGAQETSSIEVPAIEDQDEDDGPICGLTDPPAEIREDDVYAVATFADGTGCGRYVGWGFDLDYSAASGETADRLGENWVRMYSAAQDLGLSRILVLYAPDQDVSWSPEGVIDILDARELAMTP